MHTNIDIYSVWIVQNLNITLIADIRSSIEIIYVKKKKKKKTKRELKKHSDEIKFI